MGKWYRFVLIGVAIALLVIGIRACSGINQSDPSQADNNEQPQVTGLTLRDVTLEQPDENGHLIWKVKAEEATYSPDKKTAFIKRPNGELFQDGKTIYRVKADTGEIRNDGKAIYLRGHIVATGVENKVVLKGNQLEWRPDDDILIVSDRITGTHPQLRAAADEARLYQRAKRLELEGKVVATTVEEPLLKLQANQLDWFWEEERVDSKEAIRVEQLEEKKVINYIIGQQGKVDLKNLVVTLKQAVQMELLQIPLRANSEQVVWQVRNELVVMDQPLRVVEPKQQVTVTADRGRMDLEKEIIYLTQNVRALGEKNQSQLTSDQLTWTVPNKEVVAEGNVNYRQIDPTLAVRGPRAVGHLDEQIVVVSGGQVVTEIVPR